MPQLRWWLKLLAYSDALYWLLVRKRLREHLGIIVKEEVRREW